MIIIIMIIIIIMLIIIIIIIIRIIIGLRHWRFGFIYLLDGILTCFSILILYILCGKPMKKKQKVLFC